MPADGAVTVDLVADIGGTNTRCALSEGGRIMRVRALRNASFSGLTEILLHYLAEAGRPARLDSAALSVAAPVLDDRVQMTNIAWGFSRASLARTLGVRRLYVVNDFTALSWSLLRLKGDDLAAVGPGTPDPRAARAVLGPGTGLGCGLLAPCAGGDWSALPTEGGHVTLAATDDAEEAVIGHLRRKLGHVSAERVISGPGLALLHATLAELAGQPAAPPQPPEAVAALADAGDAAACDALAMLFGMLGTVAGNLALSAGTRGGVYIAGGIVPTMLERFRSSGFRERFEAKGRYRDYLRGIPVWVITREQPALSGLVELLERSRH